MNPTRIEYDLGVNAYEQPCTLIRYRDTGGRMVWMIERGAANQRDDESSVGGLTTEQLKQILAAIHNH